MIRFGFALLLGLSGAALATPAQALLCQPFLGCTCNVSATAIAFGNVQPLAGGVQTGTGTVSVSCTGVIELAPSVAVRINPGLYGSVANRQMRAPAGDLLAYNIYSSSLHNVIWGDGTGGSATATLSGGLLSLGAWNASRTMYAAMTPALTTKPGAYADALVVRIDW